MYKKEIIRKLITEAKAVSGLKQYEMAEKLKLSNNRISEWKKGKFRPDNDQIRYFCELADWNTLDTIKKVEGWK
jgi:ribosome-binding protein aMBF1 (putative translation factor)